jgi:glycosyltransferase involved in cell wall biosynthesis
VKRVISDIQGLGRVAAPGCGVVVVSQEVCGNRWLRNMKLLRSAIFADYLVVHFALPEVVFFSLLLFLIPFGRCRLVTLDFFVVRPASWQLPLVRWSLRRIETLLVYFRDSARFEDLYHIPHSRFRYIPFKINSWEAVQKAHTSDSAYVFVGGRSRRDFRTLFEAVKDMPWPVKVLTAAERDITPHGSSLAGLAIPPNVEMLYNDSDAAFFVDLMANARLVVLPIVKESAVQAGIGVYLLGMALGKCVIISEALGVGDVLTGDEACIIPPGDPAALREAVRRLWDDDRLREQYAARGYKYAIALGGEDQLRASVLSAIGVGTVVGVTLPLEARR